MEYPMCTWSVKQKKIFVIACLQKSSFFNRKFRLLRLFYFQKYRNFIGTRNCPKRTELGMEYPICTQSVKEKKFWYSQSWKKVRISIGYFGLLAYHALILFSKIQKFYRVKGLSKSNQTRYGVSRVYLERKTKRIFVIACLGKNFVFQSEISTYSLIIRLFYFQKFRIFIGSRSCPNRTKLAMDYPMCTQSVKRKTFLIYKKDRFSFGNFDFFGYFIFKNIEI